MEISLLKTPRLLHLKIVMLNGNTSKGKTSANIAGLPVIECSCGYKILIIPSLKAMRVAIDAHVKTHELKIKDPDKAVRVADRVRSNLIEQVFEFTANL